MKTELYTIPKAEEGAVTAFFRRLLSEKIADAALIPQRMGKTAAMTLAATPESVVLVDSVSPIMAVNSAAAVGELTSGKSAGQIAAFLRPCEARAVVELIKLQQAVADNLLLISADCFGTFPVKDFADWAKETDDPEKAFLALAGTAAAEAKLRAGCRLCVRPEPAAVDVAIRLFGADLPSGVTAEARTEKGAKALQALKLPPGKESPDRSKRLAGLVEKRQAAREKIDLGDFLSLISNCVRCYNCRSVCPICCCKECLFSDPMKLGYDAGRYLSWAQKKGAIKMPADTLLFQLTRLNHMVSSCVSCGMCEAACPNDIPLSAIYASIGSAVSKLFDYEPGRSFDDPLPLATFREDELKTVED
ncbi:MAG: hypothetical protein PHO89_11520 [Methylacidiphilaceae bacterium]|nr:hypothetical protein [Candidatus Methylacidiphilaceae bacterium]